MNGRFSALISAVEDDLCSGFLYTHTRINDNTRKILESRSFLYALVELLNEKGLLAIQELDERKKQVAERLVQRFTESGLGLMYQEPECDKYAFAQEAQVDCQSRLSLCKSICCKFPFALSRQDVEEGIIRREFGRPYLIAHDAEGCCVHLDREAYRCTAYNHRPMPCRGFNCSNGDKWKVWLDFEDMEPNDELSGIIAEEDRMTYVRRGLVVPGGVKIRDESVPAAEACSQSDDAKEGGIR